MGEMGMPSVLSLLRSTYWGWSCLQEKSKNEVHIVVVGAGIAGLSAADYLINRFGFKYVTVLEAQNRIGGRIHPVPYGDGFIELGAEWIHGSQNSIYDLAREVGALPTSTQAKILADRKSYFLKKGGYEISEDLLEMFHDFFSDTEESLGEIVESGIEVLPQSIGQLFENSFEIFLSERNLTDSEIAELRGLFEFAQKTVEIEHASSDWHKISFRTWSKYVELPHEQELSMNRFGYKLLLNSMESRINSSNLRLNSQVVNIDWSNLPIKILLANKEEILADHVILTCPLGHLQHYGLSLFLPEMPPKKWKAILAMGFDSVEKVFLTYDEPFWTDETEEFNFIYSPRAFSPEAHDLIGDIEERELWRVFHSFSVHAWHKGVLQGFVGGKDIDRFQSSTDQEIIDAATLALRKFCNFPVPSAKQIFRSFWHKDSLFHGSYSWYSVSADASNVSYEDIAEPLYISHGTNKIPGVLFAGEATHSSMFQTTHGAMNTGWREARRLARYYSKSPEWIWRVGGLSPQRRTPPTTAGSPRTFPWSLTLIAPSLSFFSSIFRAVKESFLKFRW